MKLIDFKKESKTKTKKTILIVDDDATIQKLLSSFIQSFSHYKSIVAEDGDTAHDLIKNSPPDLIILDMTLPRVSGAALFQDILKSKSTKNIPVIFISGVLVDNVLQDEVLQMGAAAYFTKPLDLKKLMKKIDSLLLDEIDLPSKTK